MGSVGRTFTDVTHGAGKAFEKVFTDPKHANIGQIVTVASLGTAAPVVNVINHPTDLGGTLAIGGAIGALGLGAAAAAGAFSAAPLVAAAPASIPAALPTELASDVGLGVLLPTSPIPEAGSLGAIFAGTPAADTIAAGAAGSELGPLIAPALDIDTLAGSLAATPNVVGGAAAAGGPGFFSTLSSIGSTISGGIASTLNLLGLSRAAGLIGNAPLIGGPGSILGGGGNGPAGGQGGTGPGGAGGIGGLGGIPVSGGGSSGGGGTTSTTINQASQLPNQLLYVGIAVLGLLLAKRKGWIALLVMLGFASPARAQWQPGGLIAHNHTGPNDGGQLSNLSVIGTITATSTGTFSVLITTSGVFQMVSASSQVVVNAPDTVFPGTLSDSAYGLVINSPNAPTGASFVLKSSATWVFNVIGDGNQAYSNGINIQYLPKNSSSFQNLIGINTNGNFGIGTLTPDQRLHVIGAIHTISQLMADGGVMIATTTVPASGGIIASGSAIVDRVQTTGTGSGIQMGSSPKSIRMFANTSALNQTCTATCSGVASTCLMAFTSAFANQACSVSATNNLCLCVNAL